MSTLSVLRFACKSTAYRNVRTYNSLISPMLTSLNRNTQPNADITYTSAAKDCYSKFFNFAKPINRTCYFSTKLSAESGTKEPTSKTDSKSATETEGKLKQEQIEKAIFEDSQNLSLIARFKLMYKKYWYVLIPVHVVTSVGWLGGFYYLSKSGVDVPSLLQYVHLSETIINKVQGSDMGHYAIAYLCYKVATPLRYAVTLGGTTISIKYLVQSGHIKPVPTKNELLQMYEDKKADRAKRKQECENTNK